MSFINYVTNYTPEEVTDIIAVRLKECSIYTQSQNTVFKNASVSSKRFSPGAEVLKSTSKNGAYTYPFYLFSSRRSSGWCLTIRPVE